MPAQTNTITGTKIIRSIADGDYNRSVVIEAVADGIEIDDLIFISYEWLDRARKLLPSQNSGAREFPRPA